ncbi:hypothetical protein Pla163_16660 [Planctomycetes bacterium Pla163]|uniref:Uncharacterized protein n=1 Tax=Rohdeia mirabilis TaxID=2528008 RepID=A0A518CZD3_9BACT|nr:hypothetical protein Pla163_16660 [Planctomycetes bacterium Pla163]
MLQLASHPQTVGALTSTLLSDRDSAWLIGSLAVIALVLSVALVVLAVLFVRRSRSDPALVAGGTFTLWRTNRDVFWGRLEPRGRGLVLRFERSYAPAHEPRRAALALDARDACNSLALVRPLHLANERAPGRDLTNSGADRARTAGPRGALGAFLAETLEALELALERALRSGRPQPLQERGFLGGWRGRDVVIELANGARLAGRLTHVGPAWLRLVDVADGRAPESVEVARDAANTGAALELRTSASSVELVAAPDVRGVAHVHEVQDGTRAWSVGVTLLPGTELVLPWPGADDLDVRARVDVAIGLELLVPRATARVVFVGDSSARTER